MTIENAAATLKPVEIPPAPATVKPEEKKPQPAAERPWPSMSASIAQLAAALAKAQGQMTCAPMNQVLKVNGEKAKFESPYADLGSIMDTIRDAFAINGLAVLQPATVINGNPTKVRVRTILAHASGEWISSELELAAENGSPQKIGGAIGYARRYGLASLAGVAQAEYADEVPAKKASRPAPPPHSPTTGEVDDGEVKTAFHALMEGLGEVATREEYDAWGKSVQTHDKAGRLSEEEKEALRKGGKSRLQQLGLSSK